MHIQHRPTMTQLEAKIRKRRERSRLHEKQKNEAMRRLRSGTWEFLNGCCQLLMALFRCCCFFYVFSFESFSLVFIMAMYIRHLQPHLCHSCGFIFFFFYYYLCLSLRLSVGLSMHLSICLFHLPTNLLIPQHIYFLQF